MGHAGPVPAGKGESEASSHTGVDHGAGVSAVILECEFPFEGVEHRLKHFARAAELPETLFLT